MHILLFTPYFNQPRGNATTSRRIIHFLQEAGIQTSVFPYGEKDLWYLPQTDVVHILHATRFVQWLGETGYQLKKPYLVTMGGTDINVDLQTKRGADVISLLEGAEFLTVFTDDAFQKISELDLNWAKKTVKIPQAVWTPWKVEESPDYSIPTILLPAGLRPVKDVLHPLPALDQLVEKFPRLAFTILGASLDQQVYQQVKQACASRPWMHYAGVVPFDVMTQWYNTSNIVLNTSISEGQSLAIMEAMSIGRPVVARKNPANESLIIHRETGWLYEKQDEFIKAITEIMTDPTLRQRVIHQAKVWAGEHASPALEVQRYIELYHQMSR
ncbi:glycosyltransferase [Ammoniphilus resinae]|uniref:Glycosyltransferase involved in cell wall biosynthesis n=1 Tax=Ammoniphilus resinae TaxID=861532 RepID=A0ABS4GSX8_9BACL|nr:glycosyltransferase [Ammoniphilus resinae]MBP1932950.1 glycosyltransferase involved in cell wall biosynthesis [Ammoniphilus resinae]